MRRIARHFTGSFVVLALGLMAAFGLGWIEKRGFDSALNATFICLILAILEISLSFDNAVVNASILNRMDAKWKHRFLTWGMIVAVFGIRLVLPLGLVAVMSRTSPVQALQMAISQPDDYAALMQSIHLPVAGFGGAFLLMVALKYFLDSEKDAHWVAAIEIPLSRLGRIRMVEVAILASGLWLFSRMLSREEASTFLLASLSGTVLFLVIDLLSSWLEKDSPSKLKSTAQASLGLFIYLEVLDASFSFDGVIGAFAISHNLFVITLGLGIGAFFVRSLTILLVQEQTLAKLIYLEHGAFYAIGALGLVMVVGSKYPVPEPITAFLGAGLIGLSFASSVRYNRGLHSSSKETR